MAALSVVLCACVLAVSQASPLMYIGSHVKVQSQVYGGSEVPCSRYGYMVFTICLDGAAKYQICSGGLVAEEWVLMSAHCFDRESSCVLVAGRSDLSDYINRRMTVGLEATLSEAEFHLQERRPLAVFQHEAFNASTYDSDLALVRLNGAFVLNENVSTINMSRDEFTAADSCTVLGWGATTDGLNKYSLMAASDVTALPIASCQRIQSGRFLCLQKSDPPKGVCKGDSGSPLVCGGVVRGIASYAYNYRECGDDDEEYYLDTYPYLDWIEETMEFEPRGIGRGMRRAAQCSLFLLLPTILLALALM